MHVDMTAGAVYDFVIRPKSGGPVDMRVTPITLVMQPPDGYDPNTQGKVFRHLNGQSDLSENNGGQVRFRFLPVDTAAMLEGTWLVWFCVGLHGTTQRLFGRDFLLVVKPKKSLPLTNTDT